MEPYEDERHLRHLPGCTAGQQVRLATLTEVAWGEQALSSSQGPAPTTPFSRGP